jgi:hypothetical protein
VRVNNDTQPPDPLAPAQGDAELFPRPEWVDGRARFPKSTVSQSPLCYVRGKTVTMTALLRVTRPPPSATTVTVQAQATIGRSTLMWSGSVTVNPNDQNVRVSLSGAARSASPAR